MRQPLSFFVITDTHYFENALGASGEAYEKRSLTDQKCIAETGAIIDAAFSMLAEDTSAEVVLIPGDLVFNGEKASHLGFIKKLETLKAAGKRIFVIAARHDYNETPVGYVGDHTVPVEGTARDELPVLYREFGFGQALAFHERTHSYIAPLAPGVCLFALNCDGDDKKFRGFDDEHMAWIREQALAAQQRGDYMVAINHYPILPGSPVMGLVRDAKVSNWEQTADALADMGIRLLFSGHMHMQTVNRRTSPNGNTLYDVCTGSLVGCPASIRKVTLLDEDTVEITSRRIEDFAWDKDGKTGEEYFRWRFERMIRDTIDAMAFDPVRFLRKVGAGDAKKGKVRLVRFLGRRIQTLTLGKIGRLLCIKVPLALKPVQAKELGIEIIRNMFEGDEPYTPGTPIYILFMKVFQRLRPVVFAAEKILGKKNPLLADLPAFVSSLIGNDGIFDNQVVLNLKTGDYRMPE